MSSIFTTKQGLKFGIGACKFGISSDGNLEVLQDPGNPLWRWVMKMYEFFWQKPKMILMKSI
jgi:hypothetical protein